MSVRPDGVAATFRDEIVREALAICLKRPSGSLARWPSVHLRGVLAQQRGDTELALAYFRRACALAPSEAAPLHDLGDALLRQGLSAAGLGAHLRALTQAPHRSKSYLKLAGALHEQRHHTAAAAICQHVLGLHVDEVSAYMLIGDIRAAQERHTEAVDAYSKANELAPNDPDLHRRVGRSYAALKQDHRAIDALRRGLTLAPDDPMLNVDLAEVLIRVNQTDEALRRLDIALRSTPEDVRANRLRVLTLQLQGHRLDVGAAWIGLAAGLETRRRFREAAAAYQQACVNPAERLRAWRGLARAAVALGTVAEAVKPLEAVVARESDHTAAHVELGLALQQIGRTDRAWDELAWFHRGSAEQWMHVEQPIWNGGPLNGQTILLWATPEQNMGETLLSLRYSQFAKLRGGHVMIQCDRAFVPLARMSVGVDHVVATGGPLLPYSVHAPLLHLPSLVPAARSTSYERPYLLIAPATMERWCERLRGSVDQNHIRVGIAWADDDTSGAVHQGYRAHHRASWAALQDLARCDRVRMISLQRAQYGHELLASPHRGLVSALLSERPQLTDLAAVIANLDLVITVDTAVAHLAGALGVQVWTLLPYAPAWPWPADGHATPWYPTMRLFRQRREEDWRRVVGDVQEALRDLIHSWPEQINSPSELLGRVRES